MSIATEITRLQTAKANLKTQIEAKGVSVPSTATIDTYATYVQEIPQGGGETKDYFKITNRTATAGTITFTQSGSVYNLVLKLSTDGTNWTNYDMSATTTVVLPANGYVMIDGINNEYVCYDSNKRWQISADVDHDISGKLSSLIGKSMIPAFGYLFFKDTHLINASGLSLGYTVLTSFAYSQMFNGCSSLTTAPELSATNLGDYCYSNMFYGCSSLTTAPELPSTTLKRNCYAGMFQGCTSLTTAPTLPATTLANNCYQNMFQGCTSLTTAPELPATSLASSCYYLMFKDCTNLNSITCLATIFNTGNTRQWVTNVASQGTFYCASGMTNTWTKGENGCPENWTIQEYSRETYLILDISSIPNDGAVHEYKVINSDNETITVLKINTSDWTYENTDDPDGHGYGFYTDEFDDQGDLSQGFARWKIKGQFNGRYYIYADSTQLQTAIPDYDGSEMVVYVDVASDTMATFSCYDEWDCVQNNPTCTWDPNTGTCDCGGV